MMHKMMEDYDDDTFVKTTQCNTHLQDLGLILDHMETFSFWLNPKKFAFGVNLGKLLGYIVSIKGIEVDLGKVQEIMEMPPPCNISQIRGLQRIFQSIHKFISQLEDKSQTFTKTLHKCVKYVWNKDCDHSLT